jgi:hypothetical protein
MMTDDQKQDESLYSWCSWCHVTDLEDTPADEDSDQCHRCDGTGVKELDWR